MDTCTILYIHFIPHADKVHIPADHSIEPYTAIIPHDHITYYRCIRSKKTVRTELRVFVIDGKDQGHWMFIVYGLSFIDPKVEHFYFIRGFSSTSSSLTLPNAPPGTFSPTCSSNISQSTRIRN